MGRLILSVLALTTAWATPLHAQPVTYRLDEQRSWVHFEVLHFNTSTARGRFGPVRGVVLIDPAAQRGELSLRIPTASLDTGLRVFDARLREADLLASADHPEAYFVASRFRFEGRRLLEVRGEFTLRGISQPLSLLVMRYGCRPVEPTEGVIAGVTAGVTAGEVCGGDFEAEFKRSDFGATFGLPWIADRVRLVIQVEGQSTPR